MGNLMTSMNTGVSGLWVNQAGINATGHNLANVDTRGYVRQQVLSRDFNYNAVGRSSISTFQVGMGTDMAVIRQVRDSFLDKSYRLEVGRQGFYESQYEAVSEIESLFGEMEGVAFGYNLSDFWSSMQELAKEPDDTAKRSLMVESGITFLERAEKVQEQLQKYQSTLNKQILDEVGTINNMGRQIADLNKAIAKNEAAGQSANDYRDARNQLLDDLGQKVNISYREDKNGIVTVNIEGAQFVSESNVYLLAAEKISDQSEMLKVTWANSGKEVFDLESAYSMDKNTDVGSLKGLLVSRGNDKANYTDIPIREDFSSDAAYNNAVREFNNTLSPSVIMTIQAQFDQLVHGVVTAINDVLSPNTDVSGLLKDLKLMAGAGDPIIVEDAANNKTYTINGNTTNVETRLGALDTDADGNKFFIDKMGRRFTIDESGGNPVINITNAKGEIIRQGIAGTRNGSEVEFVLDGKTYTADTAADTIKTDETIESEDFLVWDEANSPVGMDKDKTVREGMFNRKNTERYTEAEMTYIDENGDPQTKTVYIYNKEDPEDNYSLFTIGEIKVNEVIKNDVAKIPLSGNGNQGLEGAFDIAACDKLLKLWDNAFASIDPNVPMAKSNFIEYYREMIGAVSNRGKVMAAITDQQSRMVKDIDGFRQSVMGVSSEEELTNLIKFQQGYNANAKYIQAIDEMLQHIIEKLG